MLMNESNASASTSRVPRIKEDLKRDILDYLYKGIEENSTIEHFTYPEIMAFLDEYSEKTDPILEELEEEETITSHNISFKIYVPKCEKGDELIERLTAQELLAVSPYWMMVFSLLIFYVIRPYLRFQISQDFAGTTLDSAYKEGIRYAIPLSAIVCVIGGKVLQDIAGRLKKMQILSPERYNQTYEIAKITVLISVAIPILSYMLSDRFGYEIKIDLLTIFLAALALSVSYVTLQSRGVMTNEIKR